MVTAAWFWPDKDSVLLLPEFKECRLWRYLGISQILCLSLLCFCLLLFSFSQHLSPALSSFHGPTVKRRHWNGGPFHLCHSSILLWYVLISPNQPSWNSSEDFIAMCTASTPSVLSLCLTHVLLVYRCSSFMGLDHQSHKRISLRAFSTCPPVSLLTFFT